MQISMEGTKPLQFSAPERVEAALIPVKDEAGSSTHLLHRKIKPILKIYTPEQLKDGAVTAYAYLIVYISTEEMEALLSAGTVELEEKLLGQMPDLLECEPALVKAMEGGHYPLPIDFRLLREMLNDELVEHYYKENDQEKLALALHRSLALYLLRPENKDLRRRLKDDKSLLSKLPPEACPAVFQSKIVTANLRDASGKIHLNNYLFFHLLHLMAVHKDVTHGCAEKVHSKVKILQGALQLRKLELGLKDNPSPAPKAGDTSKVTPQDKAAIETNKALFQSHLAQIDNAGDLFLLLHWGKNKKLPGSELAQCDQKLVKVMCSDLMTHIGQPVPFETAKEHLSRFIADFTKPNLSDEEKFQIQTAMEELESVKLLREAISKVLSAEAIQYTVKARPYSEFTRGYRALRVFGTADRSEYMQRMMKSLFAYDLLKQYVNDNDPNNVQLSKAEDDLVVEAATNRSKQEPSVNIYSMPKRERAKMLKEISDRYKNDQPMPWQKEEPTTRKEPPASLSAKRISSDINLDDLELDLFLGDDDDDVFS